MIYSKQRLKELTDIKKAAVSKIQSDIAEFESSTARMYIEEFNDEFRVFQGVCRPGTVLCEAAKADLIWIGDYHALPRSQAYAAEFLADLHKRNPRLAIAVEPVFGINQKILNLWQSENISDHEFLTAIRYYEEWGYDWSSYQPIFETARDLEIPIFGVDCHPRHDMRSISRRDTGIARRIARIIEQDPDRTLVVIFGESHFASNHLPARLRGILRRKGLNPRELLILQNLDSMYWQIQEAGLHNVRSVRIKDGQYCVFNATPIEKYESFRQYLHGCVEDDSIGDCTVFVQTLVDVMTEFLRLKGPLVSDHMPKVYSWQESPPSNVKKFRRAAQDGTSYIPELNSIFVESLHLGSAVEASTRFIHQFCRGDFNGRPERAKADRFFVSVIEHALGYFCSKLLDSSRDGIEPLADRVLNRFEGDGELAEAITLVLNPAKRPRLRHFEILRAAVAARAGGQKMQQSLGQLLGYALGRRLYQAYVESRISRKEIHAIFHDPLNTPQRPLECYMELTDRLTVS